MTCPVFATCRGAVHVDSQSLADSLGYRQRVVCSAGHSRWEPGPKSIKLQAQVGALRAKAVKAAAHVRAEATEPAVAVA